MADPQSGTLWHGALLYDGTAQYVDVIEQFVQEGVEAGQPILMAVPGQHLKHFSRRTLQWVDVVDMTRLGQNPSRIIPAIRQFVDRHRAQRTWFVGEPIWHGRSPAEIREATRHEALLNLAFADAAINILCPYDIARLDSTVLADASLTHPVLIGREGHRLSASYANPAAVFGESSDQLPVPLGPVETARFDDQDLSGLRRWVERRAAQAGLSEERLRDLVFAVAELGTNSLVHARAPGRSQCGKTATHWSASSGMRGTSRTL